MWRPDYITADDLRDWSRASASDELLTIAIKAASRAIDRHCRRQFGQVDEPQLRRYTPVANLVRGRWVIPMDDLMDADTLTVEIDGAGTVTDYDLEPVNAELDGQPWTQLSIRPDSTVQACGEEYEAHLTGPWGWLAFPDVVINACLIQSDRWSQRSDSPFGIAGSPELGSELRLLAKVDPDVAVMLTEVRRLGRPR